MFSSTREAHLYEICVTMYDSLDSDAYIKLLEGFKFRETYY